MSDYPKVVRDGSVAVLVSPGYGAGWSTWNTEYPQCIFDPDVVAWVEGGSVGPLPNLAEKYGCEYFCTLGAEQLLVIWIPQGILFDIDEYDGYEGIKYATDQTWKVA